LGEVLQKSSKYKSFVETKKAKEKQKCNSLNDSSKPVFKKRRIK